MYPTTDPPRLTGRWRFKSSRWGRKPVLEVEESRRCIKSLHRPPREDNIALGYAWRIATMDDLLHPTLRELLSRQGSEAP